MRRDVEQYKKTFKSVEIKIHEVENGFVARVFWGYNADTEEDVGDDESCSRRVYAAATEVELYTILSKIVPHLPERDA